MEEQIKMNKREHYAYNRTYQPIQLKVLLSILKEEINMFNNRSTLNFNKCLEIIEEIELRID
jgi:hypothetical protein